MEGTIAGANWDGLKYIMYAIYIYIYNYLYIDIIYIDIIYICIYVYIYTPILRNKQQFANYFDVYHSAKGF